MCGLTVLIEPGRRFDESLLDAIDGDLHHRGPDSAGRVNEPGLAMIFRRLAILDPTPGSDQPMTDASGTHTIVFNGEIYNYRALRAELEQAGARLRTDGDTEAIVEGYALWGEQILDKLEGMYAFAIHDRQRNVVIAARDPFGIKPLYLLRRGALAALASEMRPLMRLTDGLPDPRAMPELLIWRWAAGRLSNVETIERVLGGTVLTIRLWDGGIGERRFYDPLDTLSADAAMTAEEAENLAGDALRESVTAHLASDVGYTVQLSGGVDSSLVAALASGASRAPLVTFGINLGNFEHDESAYRSQVVERYRLDHREVRLTGRDFADALPRALRNMEGPTPHLGCVLLMLLCDRIREVSKVVLTGEGADEFFGGYFRYGEWRKTAAKERLGRLLPHQVWPKMPPFAGVRRLAGLDAAAYGGVYDDFRQLHRLFPALIPMPGAREAASRRFRDFRDRLFAVDQTAYLESLLVRQDKMSMAASVEARVPYVHLPLARVLNRIPNGIRAPGGATKPLLKRIAEAHLPGALVNRRKIGLLTPIPEWLADPEGLGRYVDDLSGSDCRLLAYADRARLRATVEEFRRGRGDRAWLIMRLINLETWLRTLPAAA